jgi:hypothetical protein
MFKITELLIPFVEEVPLKTDWYAMFENRDLKPGEIYFFPIFLKPFLGLFFFNIKKKDQVGNQF